MDISIHVPSWGTTDYAETVTDSLGISIHVPSWGTTFCLSAINYCIKFQSTFPRGERHIILPFFLLNYNFNPRSLVGNDVLFHQAAIPDSISIHVPSWGTTW